MSDDPKLLFYLKHRLQIEEWADLRSRAQTNLDDALLAAAAARARSGGLVPEVDQSRVRVVRIRIPELAEIRTWVELNWDPKNLLAGPQDKAWPALIIAGSPHADFREARPLVKEATRPFCQPFGLDQEGQKNGWWIWWKRLVPVAEPIDIESYAGWCIEQLVALAHETHPVMRAAIPAGSETTGL